MLGIRRSGKRRRGVTAVTVCVSLATLIGFTALSVDVGYIYNSHGEMQAAADASALAGVTAAPFNTAHAVARATKTAHENWVAGAPLDAQEVQVQVGYWNAYSGFSLPTGFESAKPNAARVVGARQGIPLFFAAIWGQYGTDISRAATALYGGGICAGIWGLEGVDGDGDLITDSYISSEGLYGTGNIYLNGDLCSEEDVVLEGGVDVGGDVMYGYDYDLTIFGKSYSIRGGTGPHTQSVTIPTIDMAAAAANNDNATMPMTETKGNDPFAGTTWDLIGVTGQETLTLNGGTYYLTSALLEGGAKIIVTAPTTIYVDGPANFSGGGIVNTTQDPRNLVIYSTGPTLTVDGTAGFYGSIIAPTTTVTLTGDSEIYGMVMAGFLQMAGNTQIHVDTDAVSTLLGVGPEAPVLVE